MKKDSFVRNLVLHIRYPWTACCLLIMWVGLAVICAILSLSVEEVMALVSIAGVATLMMALVGFRG